MNIAMKAPVLIAALLYGGPAAAAEIETIRNVVYAQVAGEQLLTDVYRPSGDESHAAVLVVHGGAWTFGNKAQLAFVARQFAQNGFCAVAINYRLAPKHRFPAQLEDCLAAVAWMRTNAERYRIDPTRIGGYGYSAGGHLVALMATGATPKPAEAGNLGPAACPLQAVVAGGTPCDFRGLPPEDRGLAYWLGGPRKEQEALYRLASPAQHVSARCPPMLFFHGEQDSLAPLLSVKAMSAQLLQAGAISELHVVPQKGHLFAMFDEEALRRSVEFLKRHLQSGSQGE
jgi:acetyl esterase/lipase